MIFLRAMSFIIIISTFSTISSATTCPSIIQQTLSKDFKIQKSSGEKISLLDERGHLVFDPTLTFEHGLMDARFSESNKSLFIISDTDLAVLRHNKTGNYTLSFVVKNLADILKGDGEAAWLYQVRSTKNENTFIVSFKKTSHATIGYRDALILIKRDSFVITIKENVLFSLTTDF